MFLKLATATLVVVVLSQARAVLLPIAFVLVLSFILSAPMKRLQHLGLPKFLALALVMLLFLAAVGGAGYVLATQFSDLTTQLTKYNESMRRKVAALQNGRSGPLDRLQQTIERVTGGLERRVEDGASAAPVLVTTELSPAKRLQQAVVPMAEPLANIIIVLVMCAFALGGKDDLRNRLIRLVGPGNLTLTTRALDEGAQRISRYLVAQTLINLGFGIIVALGLYLIGVPYAALWGGFAALLRFIPYVGAISSMLMPATLAFAIFPGLHQMVLTLALFIGLDLVAANLVEPLVIGRRTGVSSIALLVSTLFWVWLWGPLGLVLSTPLTVSLAVLGRHIPQLRFLSVLLGDEPVLGAEISFYQRLLARDEDEASEVAQKQLGALGAAGVLDQVILPSLALAVRDREAKEITTKDMAFLVASTRDIVGQLSRAAGQADPAPPSRALAVAAHGVESEVLLEMLAAAVAPTLGTLEVVPVSTSLPELFARIEAVSPEVLCLGFLPPDGGALARQLCQRVKARFPRLPVLALRPNEPGGEPTRGAARLREAGADAVAINLAEAAAELARLLPPLKAAA
ncbi:MAG: AI-2E family transporter [Myxococcaceae bacterium]